MGHGKRHVSVLLFIGFLLLLFGSCLEKKSDPLTLEERNWLRKHDGKIVVINNEGGWPPIIDRDQEGHLFGIVMDYQRLIEKKLGFKFKPDKRDSWKNFMERFRKGEADVNNNLQKNPERSRYALFTKPYIRISNAIISRKEIKGSLTLEGMRGMNIAVTRGYAIHDYIKKNYGYLELTPLESDLDCLLAASTKNVDAAVVNLAVTSFLVEKEGIANLRVAGYAGYTNALSFASRKDWPVLNRILDKGLDLITLSERDAIFRKWVSLGSVPFYKERNFWIIAGSLTAFALSVLGMILFMNRRLKRLVEQRTESLAKRTHALKKEIAGRKRTEEELRYLRNYLSNIIDSMPSVLVGVDTQGMVTRWNKTAEQTTGTPADQALGKKLSRVFPQMALEMKRINESIQKREIKQQKRARVSEKGTCYEDVTIYPLMTNGMEGAVIRIDDVTDKVRMEEMMIQNEKMLSVGGLAAGMAHEINNPLAGITQAACVVASRLGGKPDQKANLKAAEAAGTSMEAIRRFMEARGILRMLGSINELGQRVAEIVNNMLSFARKSEGRFSSHDLSGLIDKTLELAAADYDLKNHYDFKRIEIKKEYQDPLPPVFCEGPKVQQVLLNILRNGAQAMQGNWGTDKKPRFVLRLAHEKERERIRLEIEDNGPGMDEATRKRVFEPFFTTKPVGVGTGLGLSVSYFIITENHGGEMAVESRPGSGATFIIRLPLEWKEA